MYRGRRKSIGNKVEYLEEYGVEEPTLLTNLHTNHLDGPAVPGEIAGAQGAIERQPGRTTPHRKDRKSVLHGSEAGLQGLLVADEIQQMINQTVFDADPRHIGTRGRGKRAG